MNFRDPSESTPPTAVVFQEHTAPLTFYMGAGDPGDPRDPSSGPGACYSRHVTDQAVSSAHRLPS